MSLPKEDKTSDGVILASKVKRESSLYLQYALGNGTDTCYTNCKEALVNNWVGKSELLFVLNFAAFFVNGNVYSQPDTHGETKEIEKRDSLRINGNDTFQLRLPYNLATYKGEKMGVKNLKYDPGVIIEKNGVICAALDFGVNPVGVFMLKELPKKEKLKIASFLPTIISKM